jgi:hypothetical protein
VQRYCVRVRESDTECDKEPDVPVTVTVETVDVGPDPKDEPPPPHPASTTSDRAHASKIGSPILRRRMQKHPSTVARAVNGAKGESVGRMFIIALADAVRVRVDEPEPVTLAGANSHVTPAGSPEHDRETDCVNPFSPLTLTWVLSELPADTLIACCPREREKSGGGRLMTYVAETTLLGL